jgi:hypothetical protein
MPRSSVRSSLAILVSIITIGFGGDAMAGSDQEAITARLVEVGLTIESQIELAQINLERGTLDEATLERQAEAASKALENLERRILGLPDGVDDELLAKLRAVKFQAANLARSAELGSAPPRHRSDTTRVKHLDRGFDGPRTAPANDNCEDAFWVTLGTYAGDTTEATNDGEAVCGASLDSPDVWYRFVVGAWGWVTVETVGSSYDTVLSVHSDGSVHSACPGTMSNQIVCNDDAAGLQSVVRFMAIDGHEYLIRISGSNGAVGSYVLTIGWGGAIRGTVTDTQAGAPVSTWVEVYNNDGFGVGYDNTDGSGSYTLGYLASGNYYVATDGSGDTIDELFDDHFCPGGPGYGCDVTTGDGVSVTNGSLTDGIDFVLDRQGVIIGDVRDQTTAIGVPDVQVRLHDHTGSYLLGSYTDGSGAYRLEGIPAGEYYIWASTSTHLSELYDDILCVGGPPVGCAFADGTTVTAQLNGTTSGIDFDLQEMGGVAGTVTDRVTGLPIEYADLDVYADNGDWVKDGESGADGTYEIGGLPDGVYHVTARRWNSYVDQLYDGLDCPADGCEVLTGTPVTVAGQATTAGVDFGLIQKGMVSGRVQDETTGMGILGVEVRVYDDTGSSIGYDQTDYTGAYEVDEAHAGTYFVATVGDQYFNELYDDLPCPVGCDPTSGTPVAISHAVTTTGIDFAIVAKVKITGTVTAEVSGDPVAMRIRLYDLAGDFIGSETSQGGAYEFNGLDDGQYFVLADRYSLPYLEELYDDIPCWRGPPDGCVVTDGTPVAAAAATVTTGIDFSLLESGSIEGVVTELQSGAPVADGHVQVREVSGAGAWYAWNSLDSDGTYRSAGLSPGDYVVVVDAEFHRDEVWDDLPCQAEYPEGCDLSGGTPIAVSIGSEIQDIDFSIDRLGMVGGTVRSAATGAALPSMSVTIFDGDGEPVNGGWTDHLGTYRANRLWPGTYFAATDTRAINFVDQLFEGLDCPWGPPDGCDATTGTPLAVGFNTSTRWVDFNLESTGRISGRVIDGDTGIPLEGVRVVVWDSAGLDRWSEYTDVNGEYLLIGLEEGSFFVATEGFGGTSPPYIDLLFDDIPCPGGPPGGCDPTKGTPVPVSSGSATESIDFALPPRPTGISGTVTDASTGLPIEGVKIDIFWASTGEYELGVATSHAGTYLAGGLYPTDYVVATDNPGAWINQIWDGIECPGGSAYNGDCDPTTGDIVTVTEDELTANINFVVAPTFAVFADGFDSGSTVRWSATVPQE